MSALALYWRDDGISALFSYTPIHYRQPCTTTSFYHYSHTICTCEVHPLSTALRWTVYDPVRWPPLSACQVTLPRRAWPRWPLWPCSSSSPTAPSLTSTWPPIWRCPWTLLRTNRWRWAWTSKSTNRFSDQSAAQWAIVQFKLGQSLSKDNRSPFTLPGPAEEEQNIHTS